MNKIVIVEDDPNLRETLAENLVDEGYDVVAVESCEQGLASLASAPDLMVLDVMLPDGDGYQLCRDLRGKGFAGPVMMLTARTLDQDLVEGFEAGADDYVRKPYKLVEVLARIAALLRRSGQVVSKNERDTLDGYTIEFDARRVLGPEGEELKLTKTEFDLIAYFVQHPGKAHSRDDILAAVWGDVVVEPRTVDNFVSNLKKKLKWSNDSSWSVDSVRGVGYRFTRR